MTILMQREFDKLKKGILTLSAKTEEHVNLSVKAIIERNADCAQKVINNDSQINNMEIEVEEECLKILALHQPVAADLRFIVSILKINNDLERVGDLAVNISENAIMLMDLPPVVIPFDLEGMTSNVRTMVRKCLDALINLNAGEAEAVQEMDDEVDRINRMMYSAVVEGIALHPENVASLLHLASISRHLERIGDLATNIAQDIIYMIRGEIVRHAGAAESNEGN